MANLTQFSNTQPQSGEIRVFYRENNIDGTDVVRAMTVADTSLEVVDLVPTLQGLKSLNLRISSSLNYNTFEAITVTERPGYFFIDNIDIPFAQVSASLSSSVVFTPFSTEAFNNNDYNPLISNASIPRGSEFRFDVDRSSGNVFPINFEAATGVEVNRLNFSPATHTAQTSAAFGLSLSPTSSVFGESVRFRNNVDTILTITNTDILAGLGNLNGALTQETASQDFSARFILQVQVDADKEFASPTGTYTDIANVVYENGRVNTTTTPLNKLIASGSMTGTSGGTADNFFYARFKSNYHVIDGTAVKVKPIRSLTSIDPTVDYIPLRYNIPIPKPYAPQAQVPDSNYTSTGYANARYNGAKTTKADYAGVEPALTSKNITVLELPPGRITSSNDLLAAGAGNYAGSWLQLNLLLAGISGSDGQRAEYVQKYEEIGFSGLRDEPSTRIGPVGEFFTGTNSVALTNTTDTVVTVTTQGYGVSFGIGDLLSFDSGSGGDLKTEVLKISNVDSVSATSNNGKPIVGIFKLTVIRGQSATAQLNNQQDDVADGNQQLKLNQGDRMVKIDSNRIIPIQSKTLCLKPDVVKDDPASMEIVVTDQRGFIIQAFTSASQDGVAS